MVDLTPSLFDLQFNVAGLLKGPVGGLREYDVTVAAAELDRLDEAFHITTPLSGHVRFIRTSDTVLTQFRGTTRVLLECGRCLDMFEAVLEIEFEEEFRPSIDIVTGRPLADVGDDAALVIDPHHILDLSEIIRQAIWLAMPLIPVCRPDCAGLCPSCGVNRNHESCTCALEEIDARWAGLQRLFGNW